MGAINTGNFAKFLWPGAKAIYGTHYDKLPTQYSDVFAKTTSDKAYEEYLGYSGFGLAPVKPEGSPISYDTAQQGFTVRLTNVSYGLGFIITWEMYDDNQYETPLNQRARALAFSMKQTKEIVAANVLNRATSGSYLGGDGKSLLATDHPYPTGGSWSNKLATAADLSEAALEQAAIQAMDFRDARGLRVAFALRKLVIPKELKFEAARILKSVQQSGTANNDINALREMNVFPEGVVVNNFLTDTDQWFALTTLDPQEGLIYQERKADAFDMDSDSDTKNAKYMATARYAFGWIDPRCLVGSEGA
jgi:hypothetical protein